MQDNLNVDSVNWVKLQVIKVQLRVNNVIQERLALRKVNVPTVLMDGTRMFEVKPNASNVNLVKISLVQNSRVVLVI